MRFSAYNLGCKVNQAELESICLALSQKGYTLVSKKERSDFAIINTCTVTQKADTKSFALIRSLASQSDYLRYVFITGCYSELERGLNQKLAGYPVKCLIVRQRDKAKLATIIEKTLASEFGYAGFESNYESRWQAFKESRNYSAGLVSQQDLFFMHTRAFLKVQDGCKAFCSYCRIPYARGAPISRPFENIMQQVGLLVKKNMSEIILCGINIGVYFDRKAGMNFAGLVRELLSRLTGNTQLRISSIEPQSISEDFLDVLDDPRLVPHIHLPLQSPVNRILKRMRRRYTKEVFSRLLASFFGAKKNFAVTSDVMTGYPSETPEEFQESYEFIQKSGLSGLHVFPYSSRPLSDEAEVFQQKNEYKVSAIEKKERASKLRSLSKELALCHARKLRGVAQRFIVEQVIEDSQSATWQANISSSKAALPLFNGSENWLFSLADKEEAAKKAEKLKANYNEALFCKGITNYYQHGFLALPKDKAVRSGDIFSVYL